MIKSAEKRAFTQAAASQLNTIDINVRVTFFRSHAFFRRITILFIDAPAGVEEIDFVWSISSSDQVKYWVKHKLAEVLKMLTFLRKQRDETVELVLNLQKDLNMRNKYEAAMKNNSRLAGEINYVRDQANQQRKLLILKRTRSMQLQQRLNALETSNAETEEVRRLQGGENEKSRFPSASINSRRENQLFQSSAFINFFFIHGIVTITVSDSVNGEKKFSKLSFSNKFIDKFDCELIFFDWLLKIQNCLFVNANHYSIGKHAVIFIISRTAENAVSHINAYRKGNLNYFISVEQILIFLRGIYEDRNEISNARKEYKTLKMRVNQTFNEFFFHFRRLNSLLDFFFQFQIFDLQNKIVSRFRTIFINQQHIYTSLKEMRVFFQDLNDFQRYHLEDLVRMKRKRLLSIISSAYIASIKSEVVVVVVPFRSTSAVFVTLKSAAVAISHVHNHDSSMICFHCGEFGHVKINCLNLNKPAVIRIREIIDESDENMEKTSDQIDEAGNA